jgi:multiple sugar transport system substrate-binding protein
MKRSKWLGIVLCLALVVALVGCSKKAEPTASTVAPAESAAPKAADPTVAPATAAPTDAPAEDITTKKISISVVFPDVSDTARTALEKEKVKRFIAKYPNVKVTPDTWQYNPTQIGAKAAGGQLPTVFKTYATEGKMLVDKGWVADITDLFSKYEFASQINPTLLNQYKLGDKVYGIPQDGYVSGIGINKKLLDAKKVPIPPMDWTWADLLATAKAANDPAKGIAGITPMGSTNDAGWNFTNFLFTAGGEIQTVADGKVTAAFNSAAGVKALEFYKTLSTEKLIPKTWATLNWTPTMQSFGKGQTAMVIGGVDGPVEMAVNQGALKPDDVLIYPIPAAEAGGKHYGVLGGNFFVFNPKASKDEIEMAFRYATFDYFAQDGIDSLEKTIQDQKAKNKYYVPKSMDYYDPASEYGQKVAAMYAKYDNVYQYSAEFLKLAEGKPEAQALGQDYYAEMTKNIQAVFSKKDADPKALMESAAKSFQAKLDAAK